jgi:hypothetical protein
MTALTSIALSASIIGAGVSAMGAIRQGQAAGHRADFDIAMINRQAERDRQIGALNARRLRDDAEAAAASQRAHLAGRGGDQSTGSALLIQVEGAEKGEFQAKLEESNTGAGLAERQAQIVQARARGANARTASFYRAGSALLQPFRKAKDFSGAFGFE